MENNFNLSNNINSINGNNNIVMNKKNQQNNIDQSKHYQINISEIPMSWANPLNPDIIPYKRSPKINDRPLLEKYFKLFQLKDEYGALKNITKLLTFYTYVAYKQSRGTYVLTNLIGEFGEKFATHVVVKEDLEEYVGCIIKFKGTIYYYNDKKDELNNINELKYSIVVIEDTIKIIKGQEPSISSSPWNELSEDTCLDILKLSGEFNKLDYNSKREMLYDIEENLNQLSNDMFNAPNMIYPLILSKFLMRDDIYNENVILNNIRHLNILTTIIMDYILAIRPKSFIELLRIVTYYTLTYLGLDFNNVSDNRKLREFATSMGISEGGFKESLRNAKQNAGGVEKILESIPEMYRVKPGSNPDELHYIATIQFIKRLYYKFEY